MDHNKPYDRIERVNNQIHDILGGILNKNIDLNYLGFVTFTKIDVSRDLRVAKVFYSIINPTMSMEKVNIEINKHRKPFKKYMGPELSMKHTPDLKFYYDDTFEYTEYVSTIMKNQNSIDENNEKVVVKGKGRHDPCVVPRAVPIVEAMAANVIVDLYLQSKTIK